MTDVEVLIGILKEAETEWRRYLKRASEDASNIGRTEDDMQLFTTREEFIAGYLIRNKVFVPPVRVGEVVYKISPCALGCDISRGCFRENLCKDCEHRVEWVNKTKFRMSMFEDFGKTIFPTREEAENALMMREEENG